MRFGYILRDFVRLLREYAYVCMCVHVCVHTCACKSACVCVYVCVPLGWECLAAVHSGPLLRGLMGSEGEGAQSEVGI